MNAKWIIIIVIALAAAWLLFGKSNLNLNFATPDVNGTFSNSSLDENGQPVPNVRQTLGQNSTANLDQRLNASYNSSAGGRGSAPSQNASNFTRYTLPISGDGKCTLGETCKSTDCPCSDGLTCSSNQICIPKSTCGDGINSPGETCCIDSGCPATKYCDLDSQVCKSALPKLSTSFISTMLNTYVATAQSSSLDSASDENLTYLSQFPDTFNDKPVTVVIVSCGTSCTKFLIVNASGQVQGEIQ